MITEESPTTLGPDSRGKPRDPLLDLLRSGALLVVVLWHWIFTSVRWGSDGPHVGNPVAATPGLWVLTWVLQIMPAFFIVGGALHAMDRSGARTFWLKRSKRLLLPVLPLLILAGGSIAIASFAGRHDLVRGVILVISPMWFLATYMVCILVAPAARRAHVRYGTSVIVAGVGLALFLDWLRIGLGRGGVVTGLASFCVVWSVVHQLGFSFARLRSAGRRAQASVAMAGYTLLGLAAWLGPYPAAMVGLDGHKLSNMGPPTIMVIFLGVGQLGLICLLAPLLERAAERFRNLLSLAGEWAMTVYAWHLSAYALFWAFAVRMGVDVSSTIDADWWRQRPLWLVGPAILAVPVCWMTRGFDRTSPRSRRSAPRLQGSVPTSGREADSRLVEM